MNAPQANPSVGLIGLGAMGGAVARRLLASGINLTVHDVAPDAMAALSELGAATAPNAADLAATDIVLVSLPNDDIVEDVLVRQGLLAHLTGTVVVELSTILPDTMHRIAAEATKHGVEVVDSPVSGGPNEALSGKLVLMVGADPAVLAKVEPVISQIGTLRHVGEVGAGKAIKIVNNMMSMGNVALASEAFALGVQLGLEPTRLYEILSVSGGASTQFVKRAPYVLENDYTARFAVSLAEKDLRLALAVGHHAKLPLPIAAQVHQIYEMGVATGVGQEDAVAVFKLYEQWGRAGRPALAGGDDVR